MRIEYTITGTLELPDGTEIAEYAENIFVLPDGKAVSVHPIIEMVSNVEADDHRNLTYPEAQEIGVEMEDYDRSTVVLD